MNKYEGELVKPLFKEDVVVLNTLFKCGGGGEKLYIECEDELVGTSKLKTVDVAENLLSVTYYWKGTVPREKGWSQGERKLLCWCKTKLE